MKRRIAWWILTVLCAVLILGFSSQSASQSGKLSSPLTHSVLDKVPEYQELPSTERTVIFDKVHKFVRGLAHIALFSMLGFCASMLVRSYGLARWIRIAFSSCASFAVLDECFQYVLNAGRTFQFKDLLGDWTGILLGIAIAALIGWMFRHKHQEESRNGVSSSGA